MRKNKINWDKVYLRNYASKLFNPFHWRNVANDLVRAAELFEPEVIKHWESVEKHFENGEEEILPDNSGVYFMLISFAIENLLKSAIIEQDLHEMKAKFYEKIKKNMKANKKLNEFPSALKGHNLVKLAKRAQIKMDLEEETLLRRLTRSAIWAGRYPIPLSFKEYSGETHFDDGKSRSDSHFGSDDIKKINSFLESLLNKLEEATRRVHLERAQMIEGKDP